MRSDTFSEQEASWQLPIHDANICSDAAQVGGRICVASVNPVGLYVLDKSDEQHAAVVDLTAMFPTTRGSFKPRVKLASLGERGVALHEEMVGALFYLFYHAYCRIADEHADAVRFEWTRLELDRCFGQWTVAEPRQ
jgi:hypothetical protein